MENKLKVKWSKKENDLLFTYPLGRLTKCDAAYLNSKVFTDEFVKEIQVRGYDIKTLKFEITVDEKGERFQEKFSSLSEQLKEAKGL